MTPTPRAALLLGVIAVAALVVPAGIVALLVAVLAGVTLTDARAARRPVRVVQEVPDILSRGVPAAFELRPQGDVPGTIRLRQPAPPDVAVSPSEHEHSISGTIVARRRGRHTLPRPAARIDGPLRLGRFFARFEDDKEILVYPDMPTAWRLALTVRQSRYRNAGERTRGPLGLGTEFESIRDYLPDDDIRQVNWPATARTGRPMSNQYRVEQDRDVICLIDMGRLMGAPLEDRTRLDAAVDAATAIAVVADEVGDRCGAIAFDTAVRRRVVPRRKGADAAIRAIFDLEPANVESDYELAFRSVREAKRALILVFTDLLEETAARPLAEAVPILARTHAVVIVSAADGDLHKIVAREPVTPKDVYEAAAALDVLDARVRAAEQFKRSGADVLEAAAGRLPAACVEFYLRAKTRARL